MGRKKEINENKWEIVRQGLKTYFLLLSFLPEYQHTFLSHQNYFHPSKQILKAKVGFPT